MKVATLDTHLLPPALRTLPRPLSIAFGDVGDDQTTSGEAAGGAIPSDPNINRKITDAARDPGFLKFLLDHQHMIKYIPSETISQLVASLKGFTSVIASTPPMVEVCTTRLPPPAPRLPPRASRLPPLPSTTRRPSPQDTRQ